MNKLVSVIFGLILAGCDYMVLNQPPAFSPDGASTDGLCIPQTDAGSVSPIVTYEQLRTKIFDGQCVFCHSATRPTKGLDITSVTIAKSFAQQIDFQVSRGLMPLSGPLTPEERGLISDWVKAGAPSEADILPTCETEPPADNDVVVQPVDAPPSDNGPLQVMPDNSQITFEFVRDRVFAFECFACHSNAGGNRGGLNLETYENAVDELDDIEDEVSEDSMPPRSRLSQTDKDVILRWIALGAPR